MRDVIEKSVRCDCIGGEHYLHFYCFDDEEGKMIYVDLCAIEKLSWKIRLKECLNILLGRRGCYDGIILNKNKSEEVAFFLQEYWKD